MTKPENPEEFRNRVKRLLEAFVYDHLKKTGCTDTAKTYFEEIGLDDWPPEWLNLNMGTNVGDVIETQESSMDHESVERSKDKGKRANDENEIEEHEHTELAEDGTLKVDESPNIPLPLDVPDGFLNEWWLTFWNSYNDLRERDSSILHGSNSFD
ncbi:1553_t:CDS:2 [Funneliformis caledonium]|uniref:1553_t:CDS:1 n=1 Tax=Funneliformis caledonium TaxID=1117310 RepID=A0A9N9BAG2_9GLOM|nr:1553_t:CDS:2 [Funneliformis caledonium]